MKILLLVELSRKYNIQLKMRYFLLFLILLASFRHQALGQNNPYKQGVIRCSSHNLTDDAVAICDQAYGLQKADQTVTYAAFRPSWEIRYTFSRTVQGTNSISVCIRANLDFGDGPLLVGKNVSRGYQRNSTSNKCEICPMNMFCQSGTLRLLEECSCQQCTEAGAAFRARETTVECGRCPFTCSNLGLGLSPSFGDNCFICNEESTIPDEQQTNCITLEGWWIEKPVTKEELLQAEVTLSMPFADRMRRCYPNPDAMGVEVKDSLKLRQKVDNQYEVELSHCKRNNLLYPGEPVSQGVVENTPCNGESTGALCLGCNLGNTKRGSYFGNCSKCDESDDSGLVIKIILNICIVIISVLFTLRTESQYRRKRGEDLSSSGRLLLWKIFLSHMQVLSALTLLSIPWENATLKFFKGGEYLSISRINLSCLYPDNFVSQELVFVLVFWLMMVIFVQLGVFLFHLYKKRGCDICGLEERNKHVDLQTNVMKIKIGAALIQAILVMHFLCLSMTLQLLSCFSVDFDGRKLGDSYLLKDPKIKCWDINTANGLWQIFLGIPMLFGLLVAIPIYLIFKTRKGKYDFLTIYFKNDFKYWDVVILLRKSLFLFCVILLTDYGNAVETTHAIMVIMFSLILQVYYMPYTTLLGNLMDCLGLVIITFTISLGTFKASVATTQTGRNASTALIWIINILYGLIFVVLAGLDYFGKGRFKLTEIDQRLHQFFGPYLSTRSDTDAGQRKNAIPDNSMIIEDQKDVNVLPENEYSSEIEQLRKAEASNDYDNVIKLSIQGIEHHSASKLLKEESLNDNSDSSQTRTNAGDIIPS